MGKAHVTEEDLVGKVELQLLPGARAAFFAWLHCARERPWLQGLACSHILERRNNDTIVKGGTLTQRLVQRQERELGIKKKDQDIGTQVHMIADVEHSQLLDGIFERYVVDERAARKVLRGAEESLAIERSFHGAVATAMAEMDG